MILSTIVKLKALGLAKQIATGAFINGAVLGAGTAAVALAVAASARNGQGLCTKPADARPPEAD